MITQPIEESGMIFGPYPEGHCFYIEKSNIYKNIKKNLKIAEFLLLRSNKDKPPAIWVVEAKSSAPRHFDEFIKEIREKLTNAFFLGISACLGRHELANTELPELFKTLDLAATDFYLVLVVNKHKDDWLPPLKDALVNALRSILKTWAIPTTNVMVFNDDLARKYKLILSKGSGS